MSSSAYLLTLEPISKIIRTFTFLTLQNEKPPESDFSLGRSVIRAWPASRMGATNPFRFVSQSASGDVKKRVPLEVVAMKPVDADNLVCVARLISAQTVVNGIEQKSRCNPASLCDFLFHPCCPRLCIGNVHHRRTVSRSIPHIGIDF